MKVSDILCGRSLWPAAILILSSQGVLFPAEYVSFNAPKTYAVGETPRSVAVGDFNSDGKADLAVANFGSNTISVLLGAGTGFFSKAVDYPAGHAPTSVAVSDFNGDGKPDLVVANNGTNTISILLGNGDGTFQGPKSYTTGAVTTGPMAVGDFNGDGKPDLVVASSRTISILFGNGDGSFQTPRVTGGSAPGLAVGDFNGDGKLDLVVSYPVGSSVLVLLGNGDGSFQPRVAYRAGKNCITVIARDFNADGKLDLAVANTAGASVSILLGNGDGSFQNQVSYRAGTGAGYNLGSGNSMVSGDFNGDGTLDLVVLLDGAQDFAILLGNGDGSFEAPVVRTIGGEDGTLAVGDFNGDGRPDLAAAVSEFGDVAVLLSLREAVQYPAGGQPSSAVTGDFNGDGMPDLAESIDNQGTGSVSILLGKGDGTFQPPVLYPAGSSSGLLVAGDFNSDGRPDLAVAISGHGSAGTVSVLLGNGGGTFQPAVSYAAGTNLGQMAVGDLNGDGKPDLAMADGNGITLLLGNGDGTFQPQINYMLEEYAGVAGLAMGDFNADGILDLAVANSGCGSGFPCYGVLILMGNGDGTFQSPVTYATGTNQPQELAVGDFNGDGKPDLAAVGDGGVSILLGNGDGMFQPAVTYYGISCMGIAVGDLNGDGKPDLACTNSQIWILLGNGDGTFFSQPVGFVGGDYTSSSGSSLAVADFNQDGKLDLAFPFASGNVGASGFWVLTNITP
jgi:hypothetical protein